jgi:hypothetical protein
MRGIIKGLALHKLGDYEGGAKSFDRVVLLDPNSISGYYNRAKSAIKLGDIKTGIRDLNITIENIKKFDPSSTEKYIKLIENDADFENLKGNDSYRDFIERLKPKNNLAYVANQDDTQITFESIKRQLGNLVNKQFYEVTDGKMNITDFWKGEGKMLETLRNLRSYAPANELDKLRGLDDRLLKISGLLEHVRMARESKDWRSQADMEASLNSETGDAINKLRNAFNI